MKLFNVRTNIIGYSPRAIRVNIDEDKTFKQLVDDNYSDLFPRPDIFDTTRPSFIETWENLTETSLRYFNSCYGFSAFQSMGNNHITVHLIDKIRQIKSDNIIINSPGDRVDDSVAFFLIEKYDQVLSEIFGENGRNLSKEKLREFLEQLLSETETHILVDNFSQGVAEHKLAPYIAQMIPSELWQNLTNESFLYSRKFILHLAYQMLILDYCLKHSNLTDRHIFEDISRGWINKFLYQMQNQMLVLLNIPEVFLRSLYSGSLSYSELIKKTGIAKLQENDNEYYAKNIVNKSISDIYFNLFKRRSISNYQEYIRFCEDVLPSDIDLAKIIHTYRILFNKLKHSSVIEIINSRDDESIRGGN